jgi:hypothetical protein
MTLGLFANARDGYALLLPAGEPAWLVVKPVFIDAYLEQ